MVLNELASKQVNIPVLGGVSILAVGVVGIVLWLALRRKKSISLKI